VAKSFFLRNDLYLIQPHQIIQALSDINAQLSSSLNRHSKRLEKTAGH